MGMGGFWLYSVSPAREVVEDLEAQRSTLGASPLALYDGRFLLRFQVFRCLGVFLRTALRAGVKEVFDLFTTFGALPHACFSRLPNGSRSRRRSSPPSKV